MAAATTSATHTPMHRPNTGFSPTATAKSTPWKKPPAYSMPKMEKMMSTTMGMMRSNVRPLSEMDMPLNSSTAICAASSKTLELLGVAVRDQQEILQLASVAPMVLDTALKETWGNKRIKSPTRFILSRMRQAVSA